MHRLIITLTLIIITNLVSAQKKAYQSGEWFKFRVHYGFVTAGYATLEVKEKKLKGKPVFHIIGKGKTIGMSRWFFKVDDTYETYIDKYKDLPYRFIRKIDEGGHTKNIQIDFDHDNKLAQIQDKKHDTTYVKPIAKDVQDMVSAFYYLRNNLETDNLQVGQTIDLNMFFDKENFKFRVKFLGKEVIETEFGKIASLKFRPYVQSGRVFKEKESLTVWVSDDKNKMPLLVKADLAVGSLKASLIAFKGLKNSFNTIID
jgi:hypothetical protein